MSQKDKENEGFTREEVPAVIRDITPDYLRHVGEQLIREGVSLQEARRVLLAEIKRRHPALISDVELLGGLTGAPAPAGVSTRAPGAKSAIDDVPDGDLTRALCG